MECPEKEFNDFMKDLKFKKNSAFYSDPKNLERTIDYIKTMPINENTFEIVEYLIKEFGIAILYCFETFYNRISKDTEAQKTFINKLQRIASLVNCELKKQKIESKSIKVEEFHQLWFFRMFGISNLGFKVKQKTPQQLEFIQDIEFVRSCIILKQEQPLLKSLPKLAIFQLCSIRDKISEKKVDTFMCYYLNRMLEDLYKCYNIQTIQNFNSLAFSIHKQQIELTIQPNIDFNTVIKPWDGKVLTCCPPVFKGENSDPVYILLDNLKCHIPNPECYNRIFKNWDIIVILSDEAVEKIPTGKPLDNNAALIRAQGTAPIYFLNHKIKRWIPNPERMNYFGFNWGKVQQGSKAMIENYQTGPDL